MSKQQANVKDYTDGFSAWIERTGATLQETKP